MVDCYHANYYFISLICWSLINPTTNLALVISIGLIAIASATQDIVDALRIEQIGEHEGKSMQAGAAMVLDGGQVIN